MAKAAQPRHEEIADELRQRIDAGTIAKGVPLPSDAELCAQYGVSRNTVRLAIAQLREEGIVYTIKGRGSYPRPRIPARRMTLGRYRVDLEAARKQLKQTSVTADYGLAWGQHRPTVTISETYADDELAALFQVLPGTPLSRRDLVFTDGGWPLQMATSYYLLDMVAGTWVVTPESEPYPGGAIGHLGALGVWVTRVRERKVSRMPTGHESRVLMLGAGPVLAVTRQMFAGDQVVEVAKEIVIPGENVVLEDDVDL